MANKVAIYARVSTTGGKQDYQRQIDDLTHLIKEHGYNIKDIEIFAESISGYKKNSERPELSKMIEIIKNNPQYFKIIYCTEISRLGRNPSETRQTIDALTDLQVPVYIQSLGRATLDHQGRRDGIMNIILQVLLEFANSESIQMKERTKSGLLKSARSGRAGGGAAMPFGYKKDDDKMLVVDEDEAEIIKEIYQLYMDGNGVRLIGNILDNRGVKTKYAKDFGDKIINFNIPKEANKIKWSDKTLIDIIKNPLYKGERRFKGETIPAPVIIDPVIWSQAQDIKEARRISERNVPTVYTYLLKNIAQCAYCGRNFFAKYKPVKDGDKVYICSSRLKNGGGCGNTGINISLIESAIYSEFLATDSILKHLNNIDDRRKEVEKIIKRTENYLAVAKGELPEKQNEKERLLSLYIKAAIDDKRFDTDNKTLTNQITNIAEKIKRLENELLENQKLLSSMSSNKATKKMLVEARDNRVILQTIFAQIIKKVTIANIDKDICWVSLTLHIGGQEIEEKHHIALNKNIRKSLRYLPFDPINSDIWEIRGNMGNSRAMNNLIEGGDDYEKAIDWITIAPENILTVESVG